METNKIRIKNDAKKIFLKKGTCSHAFFHILNREFGHVQEQAESASDHLAGGILRQGYQCGMLWGATLAAGAEAFRRSDSLNSAIGLALTATQHIVESFSKRTKTVECSDITEADFKNPLSIAKYLVTGKALGCYKLSEKWAPEAIEAATKGLSTQKSNLPKTCISCASEVARKMGASDEEIVMVAGFAGGLGLNGNACGALSAAIWMRSLKTLKEQNKIKSGFRNPEADRILKTFQGVTDYEMLCSEITGKNFKTIDEHTEYIKNGGCAKLIDALAGS
ncbi:MAG: C-GCAxxG-C-C family (seleno)protein [Leptospirales bacterium]